MPVDVLRILRPIAAALDYAHAKGVIHRDVKPANVMIAKDGTPYILDFGIAREIQETMTRVTGKLSSGTLLYMSPEQLMGEQPKPAQDVYSFAAMVYECLKGEPPFSRGNIEFQIMNKQPEPLCSATGETPVVPVNGRDARCPSERARCPFSQCRGRRSGKRHSCRFGDGRPREEAGGPPRDLRSGAGGTACVLRGGSWYNYARLCRSANRSRDNPGNRYRHFGFRLCCSAGPRGEEAEQ